MLSERLVEQGLIKTLDCDRQLLENKRPFLAVTFIIIIIIIISIITIIHNRLLSVTAM